MATAEDCMEMFAVLKILGLRNGPALVDVKEQDLVAETWADVVNDIPVAELKAAARLHARTSQFWPAPAEILKLCPTATRQAAQIEAARTDDGMGVWPRVVKYVGSLGRYCKPAEWKARLARDFPCDPERVPAIIAGIEAAGWIDIANSDNEWVRKDLAKAFSRAYREASVTSGKVIGMNDYKRLAANGDKDVY